MSEKKPIDQQILDFLKEKGTGTVDDIAGAVKIGRTSARKYLAGLTVDKKVNREPGGREGRRKLPDVFSLPGNKRGGKSTKAAAGRSKTAASGRASWTSTSSTTCGSTRRRHRMPRVRSPMRSSAPRAP
jgi:FaeA-like protein